MPAVELPRLRDTLPHHSHTLTHFSRKNTKAPPWKAIPNVLGGSLLKKLRAC